MSPTYLPLCLCTSLCASLSPSNSLLDSKHSGFLCSESFAFMTLSPVFHPPTFVVPAFFSSFGFSLLPVCLDALLSPTFLISLHRSLPTCRRCPLPPSTCPYPPTTLLLSFLSSLPLFFSLSSLFFSSPPPSPPPFFFFPPPPPLFFFNFTTSFS